MPSLLITVFTLQLVIHLVNTIGAAGIGNLVGPHAYYTFVLSAC